MVMVLQVYSMQRRRLQSGDRPPYWRAAAAYAAINAYLQACGQPHNLHDIIWICVFGVPKVKLKNETAKKRATIY